MTLLRRFIQFLFVFLILLSGSLLSSPVLAQQANEKCLLIHAWAPVPPFLIETGNKPTGFQVDLIDMLSSELNCKIIYQKMRWNDSIDALKSGEVDFVGRASKTPSREKWAHFSIPYSSELLVLYVKKGAGKSYNYANLESLLNSGFKLGLVSGAYYGDSNSLLTKNRYQQNIHRYNFSRDMINALEQGEVDGIFEAPFIVDNEFSKRGLVVPFDEYPLELITGYIHFMFSKKSVSESFLKKFDVALQKVKSSPEFKKHSYWPKNQ